MKNFLIYIVVSFALSITGGMIYAKYYLSPKVKELVQNKASEALGVPVQIHDLRVLILPKISLAATGVKFAMTSPNLKVEIPKVFISAPVNASLFSRTSTFGPIKIKLESPRFVLETIALDPKTESANNSNISSAAKINYSRDVSVEMSIEQAKLKIVQMSRHGEVENETNLEPLDIEMVIPGIEKNWKANLRTNLSMTHPRLSIPIEIQSDFLYKDQSLSLNQAFGNVAGIGFVLSGEQKFLEKIGNWKLTVDTPDFSKVGTPPRLPFLKNLGGGIHADLSAVLAPGQDWQFFGGLTAKSFTADMDWTQDEILVRGPFKIDCDTKFSFFKALKVERLSLHAKLEEIEINKTGIFSKPKNVPLFLDMNLNGRNQVLNILDFTIGFAGLRAYANGSLALSKDQSSELNIHIDPLTLNGWEKYLIPFSSAPLFGQLSSDVRIRGDLTKDWYLEFHPLKIEKLRGVLNYVSANKNIEISGPLDLDTEINGAYDLKSLAPMNLSFSGLANLNLSVFEYVNEEKSPVPSTQPNPLPSQKPTWAGFKNSKFKINTQIKRFHFNEFMADDILGLISVGDQSLTADLKLNKFAGGEAEIKNVILDFKKPKPEVDGLVNFKNIDANEIVSGFYPESVGIVKGEASGQIIFAVPADSQQGPLSQNIRANGKIDLKNALIANRGLDDLINEKLSQIPGVGRTKPASHNAGSEMNLLFSLREMDLTVLDFKLLTPIKSEILAKGSVALGTQAVNLTGTAFLADAPIGGDIRAANSDSQGRFVIPYSIQGHMKNPQASFAQKSVEEILKKTMLFVAKRETDKLKRAITGAPEEKLPEKLPPKALDKDDVEEQETADQITPTATPPPSPAETPKPSQNKVEAFKNRLQGIFDKH